MLKKVLDELTGEGIVMEDFMKNNVLLIDYENIQNLNEIDMAKTYDIKIFVGLNQKKLPLELVQQTQKLGHSLEWIKVNGQGKNALDFIIAFYIGTYVENGVYNKVVILSKDGGYDPMIGHINKVYGKKVRRVSNISQILQNQKNTKMPQKSDINKLVEHLLKIPGNKRPKKRKTLSAFAMSAFANKKIASEIDEIIEQMYVNKQLTESNGLIKYHIGK